MYDTLLLEQIVELNRQLLSIQQVSAVTQSQILVSEEKSLIALGKILSALTAGPQVVSGKISQKQGVTSMAIKGILPGATGTFVVSWFDGPSGTGLAGALPTGVMPVYVSSDPVNLPVVVSASDPTGNTFTVLVPAAALPGSPTVTAMATLADGTTPSTGAVVIPILSVDVESGVINQIS
jgi:hypothetical protein